MNESLGIRIVRGTEAHVPVILQLIRALADYEKLLSEVVATEADLHRSLFGPRPAAEVILAYAGDEPVGFALYFQSFSTFLGRPGIYLEDLFVLPEWRRRGIAKRLLAVLASEVIERDGGRLEWSVLNWNESAIAFYKSIGARPMHEWTVYRITGESLARLARDT